jgi:ribosomal protein S18 acetylase RimI-like enzyme
MIKPLTQSDVSFVVALEKEYNLSSCVDISNSKTWMISNEAENIGFITWIESEDSVDLLNIAISSKFSHQGYGSILLTSWLHSLKSHGIKDCFLEVHTLNTRAIDFYIKHGFIINRVRKGYYQATQEDALEMRYNYE